jgi:hypothetical protein
MRNGSPAAARTFPAMGCIPYYPLRRDGCQQLVEYQRTTRSAWCQGFASWFPANPLFCASKVGVRSRGRSVRASVQSAELRDAIVRLHAGGAREMIWHLLTWGNAVQIIKPAFLKSSAATRFRGHAKRSCKTKSMILCRVSASFSARGSLASIMGSDALLILHTLS